MTRAEFEEMLAGMEPEPWHTSGVSYHRNPVRTSTSLWGPVAPGDSSGTWIARDVECSAAESIATLRNLAPALAELWRAAEVCEWPPLGSGITLDLSLHLSGLANRLTRDGDGNGGAYVAALWAAFTLLNSLDAALAKLEEFK